MYKRDAFNESRWSPYTESQWPYQSRWLHRDRDMNKFFQAWDRLAIMAAKWAFEISRRLKGNSRRLKGNR